MGAGPSLAPRSPLVDLQFVLGSPNERLQPPSERPQFDDARVCAICTGEPDSLEAVSEGARVAGVGDREVEKFHGCLRCCRVVTGGDGIVPLLEPSRLAIVERNPSVSVNDRATRGFEHREGVVIAIQCYGRASGHLGCGSFMCLNRLPLALM